MNADSSHNAEPNLALPASQAREKARLAALLSYSILDTLPDPAFDDLTALASQICGTPISLVSLIDRDRQWFKSKRGLETKQGTRDDAFCAHALCQKDELLIVPDAKCDARFASNPWVVGETGIRFYMGAPLVTPTGEVLGTLCVIDRVPRQLGLDQQNALRALARQTMAQLELRRQNIEMAGQIALRVQTEAALRDSQEQFQAFMNHSPLIAFLKDPQGHYVYVNQPFLRHVHLEEAQIIGHDDFELWPDKAPQLQERDRKVLAGQENLSLVEIESATAADGAVSYWQIFKFPLPRGGGERRLVAGVGLDVTQAKRYEAQLESYQSQLEETLQLVRAQSLQDGLTGVYNRRAFDLKLTEEFDRAHRYHLSLSLLMVDVDHFKAFNDSFGHPAGDEVLRRVARLLQEGTRTHDTVARYGGEEFVLVLPNTGYEGAFFLGERLRRAVQSLPWEQSVVTISVGAATLNAQLDTAQALTKAADVALYRAKSSGRNLVMQAPE